MEEKVGELWHRFITRLADPQHHPAAVNLSDIREGLAIYFRALGGDGGLHIEAVDKRSLKRRRNWLQRIAGSGNSVELAWRDDNALKLPQKIAWFEEAGLNRDLYLWLAAMAANQPRIVDSNNDHWFARSQLTVLLTLQRFPGLIDKYATLVKAHLDQRPHAGRLPPAERTLELEICQALVEPGSVKQPSICKTDPFPVLLWLGPHASASTGGEIAGADDDHTERSSQTRELDDMGRRQSERVDPPEAGKGLITVRMENIFTWGEFVNLDRGNEDQDDVDQAEAVARDLDKLSITSNRPSTAVRLKFDLDLPSATEDDEILGEGCLLPEWDCKKNSMIKNCCRVVELMATEAEPVELPAHLGRTARKLRNQFQLLAPSRVWRKQQVDGQDVDLDAYLRFECEKAAGVAVATDRLYQELHSGGRDLACMLVADLSLSTDGWVNDQQRVIDVIRDSLFLFAESLHATGDRFAMIGFSTRKRNPIRIHILKQFQEQYGARIRGRINAIKPGYYTRLGAAIRYASQQLEKQQATRRLLLILTDGKPNDLDQYEGRFGIEDTRQAILQARSAGLQPFCVTIDSKANQYLPHLFGINGYTLVRNPVQMPRLLPRLYAQLTH